MAIIVVSDKPLKGVQRFLVDTYEVPKRANLWGLPWSF